MARDRTILDKFFLFVKGLSMGAANKVPGVSGGTVSFVLGFYEEMIYSFRKINYKAFLLLINGRFKSFYYYTNATFLLLVFSGSMFSYFSVSLVLDYLLEYYELYVWSSFFGMILGSIYYISKDFNDWKITNIVAMSIGAALGVAISFMNPAKENDNLWFVFACGIIGVSGMTLPGLSGSFILILLGNYVLLLVDSVAMLYKTFAEIVTGDFSFMNSEERLRYLKIIASFTAGSAFGLIFTSHILGYVLKRWHQIVTAIIIGFIAGSLGIVWPWKRVVYKIENGKILLDARGNEVVENFKRYFPDFSEKETWIAIFYILVGLGIILLIDKFGQKRKENENE
ncbi:Integral membrane protein [hydrothermal vent metagenome]|uniref:Integral membrane protein n=1 Tax=hydrothermal vent metagenome TaxID=652676 RepID=A0A3B0TJX8_9ZZZZ